MLRYQIKNIKDAFAYSLDCNLATVSSMAMLKSRTKCEYHRQIEIAQQMLRWCVEFDVDVSATRGYVIIGKFYKSVRIWADQYDVLKEK
jgi:hypothetical protein